MLTTLLGALCFFKSPCAWENFNSSRIALSSAKVPQTSHKNIRKSSWYIRPHKRLRQHAATVQQIARHADDRKRAKESFYDIEKAANYIDNGTDIATSIEHKEKNRYGNLLPYDKTRSCQELQGFYINSSDVETPVQSYLVTQGPLEQTIGDFWKMVLHRKSDVIVTLVMAKEEGKTKCASYWTIPETAVDDWKIALKSQYVVDRSRLIPTHQIVVRTFIASNHNETRTITQVHYENWPDCKIPELDLFVKLLDVVDRRATKKDRPITVHCSAGIGRSGTFVAAHSLRKEIRATKLRLTKNQELQVNIPKAIFLLRCQRKGLVSNARQYQTVLQALAKEHQRRQHPLFLY